MKDSDLKKLAGDLLDNKELIFRCLSYFNGNEIRNGLLCLHQDLLNKELYPLIVSRAMPYVSCYDISFSQNMIFVDLDLNVKQLGPLKAFYMIQVSEFVFEPEKRSIRLTFREDVKSTGNAMQAMMFKTAKNLLSTSFLEKAVSMARIPGIKIQGDQLILWPDSMALPANAKRILDQAALSYVRSEENRLVFRFILNTDS